MTKDAVASNLDFEILGYDFDENTLRAQFHYRGGPAENPLDFTEIIDFSDRAPKVDFSYQLLERALFLASIVIGTSYYKTFPTTNIKLPRHISDYEEHFFNKIYQDGLSQFAYENHLSPEDLPSFLADLSFHPEKPLTDNHRGTLVLQSGGKDSLLVAELLKEQGTDFTALYISSTDVHPRILNNIPAKNLQIVRRTIDKEALKSAAKLGGKNGHVPVTYINIAIALVQAILNGDNEIVTSIGHEGAEPHTKISGKNGRELMVNHQWSKTAEAERLIQTYVTRFISSDLTIGSPIRQYSELKVAELFVNKCWQKYGHAFSSCNVANYGQGADNSRLHWCGHCAKCANSYLLFAPFLDPAELDSIFPDKKSLFTKHELLGDFKGLLGIDDAMKPFECVGEVAELRAAYHHKRPGYPDLPFPVPASDFDYNQEY